jgi:MFS transporter, DHA3 family, tetracycline resistance protein
LNKDLNKDNDFFLLFKIQVKKDFTMRSYFGDAFGVFVFMRGMESFALTLIFTVNIVYHLQTVGLNPLQVVLVGTLLEVTILLLEIPTGVLADVYSRRLSVVIGYALMGLGFMIEGSFAIFGGVLLAQIIWGTGATFTSGAADAWIADEIGVDRAAQAYIRASQVGSVCGLLGIVSSVLLASIQIQIPIVLGGVLLVVLAGMLWILMTENGFTPVPAEERQTWGALFKTFREGVALVRGQRVLLFLLGISFIVGAFSEGWDRLWTARILSLELPTVFGFEPIVWFGIISAIGSIVAIIGAEVLRRSVDTEKIGSVIRACWALC